MQLAPYVAENIRLQHRQAKTPNLELRIEAFGSANLPGRTGFGIPGAKRNWAHALPVPDEWLQRARREAIEHAEQILSGMPGVVRPRFRAAKFEGFDVIPSTFIEREPDYVRAVVTRSKVDKTERFTYVIRLTDRIGGPDRVVGGYSRDPKRRAAAYVQLGFDARLEEFDGPFIGEPLARVAETKLLRQLSKRYEQIAPEVFVDWNKA